MNVSKQLKEKVQRKIEECISIAKRQWTSVDFDYPIVKYNVRGTTGGKASRVSWMVDFNPVLLIENEDDFISQTVPHEIAHLIARKLWSNIKPHGREWKLVMTIFGAKPRATHSYDISRVQVRTVNKFMWTCECCGSDIPVGMNVHQKMLKGRVRYHKGCGKRGTLSFKKSLGQVSYQQLNVV